MSQNNLEGGVIGSKTDESEAKEINWCAVENL